MIETKWTMDIKSEDFVRLDPIRLMDGMEIFVFLLTGFSNNHNYPNNKDDITEETSEGNFTFSDSGEEVDHWSPNQHSQIKVYYKKNPN